MVLPQELINNANRIKAGELCVNNISSSSFNIDKTIYGSIDNPLCLNLAQTKEIQVEGNDLKIITSVPSGGSITIVNTYITHYYVFIETKRVERFNCVFIEYYTSVLYKVLRHCHD